jgi:hypothetical protein
MTIEEAQRDVRQTYIGGFFGQLVSGALWAISAVFATWGTQQSAIAILIIGGFFIFPMTVLLLRLSGRSSKLSPGNPMGQLAMQAAFALPLSLPLVGAATLFRINWFYPAFMIALGAHYLPFWFLYGMRMFGILASLLIMAGMMLGLYWSDTFSIGSWITACVLLFFAFIGGWIVRSENIQNTT